MGFTHTLLLRLLVAVLSSAAVKAQIVSPLAEASCSPWNSPHVVCINHYSSVMPFHFFRKVSQSYPQDTYGSTSVPADPSFAAVAGADILVFDQERALEVLGPDPSVEFMFRVAPVNHEGPVFVPDLNELYVTQMQVGYLPQLVIDLNQSPPSLSYQEADPPLYLPSGGTFHEGLIYYSCLGGNITAGQEFRPGIYTLNATSGKSQSLLNNYFGYYFNGCDDIVVDSRGDVWFTDNCKPFSDTRNNRRLVCCHR